MKPTNLQKKICELIKSQASFWMNSNDIDSPTHLCDIDEEVATLDLPIGLFPEVTFENSPQEVELKLVEK